MPLTFITGTYTLELKVTEELTGAVAHLPPRGLRVERYVCVAGATDNDYNYATTCAQCGRGTYAPPDARGTCANAVFFVARCDSSDATTTTCDWQCPAGTHDHDSNASTPCVQCAAGTYTDRGSYGVICPECAPATIDDDGDPATVCAVCGGAHVAGAYVPAGQTGSCTDARFVCPAGTYHKNILNTRS